MTGDPNGPIGPSRPPLVSCIMPTYRRAAYVEQSIGYFSRQDYPAKELLIVGDSDVPSRHYLKALSNIRVIRVRDRTSIGEKRNIAIREARGEIIVHWDDDDWYSPTRIGQQVAPLLANDADITGLDTRFIYEVVRDQFWTVDDRLHAIMMLYDVHGGTLVYRKHLWDRVGGFLKVSLGEDARFLESVMRTGARLLKLPNRGAFIYIRHDTNAWAFDCGQFSDPRGWRKLARPDFIPADDMAFYATLRAGPLRRRWQSLAARWRLLNCDPQAGSRAA